MRDGHLAIPSPVIISAERDRRSEPAGPTRTANRPCQQGPFGPPATAHSTAPHRFGRETPFRATPCRDRRATPYDAGTAVIRAERRYTPTEPARAVRTGEDLMRLSAEVRRTDTADVLLIGVIGTTNAPRTLVIEPPGSHRTITSPQLDTRQARHVAEAVQGRRGTPASARTVGHVIPHTAPLPIEITLGVDCPEQVASSALAFAIRSSGRGKEKARSRTIGPLDVPNVHIDGETRERSATHGKQRRAADRVVTTPDLVRREVSGVPGVTCGSERGGSGPWRGVEHRVGDAAQVGAESPGVAVRGWDDRLGARARGDQGVRGESSTTSSVTATSGYFSRRGSRTADRVDRAAARQSSMSHAAGA